MPRWMITIALLTLSLSGCGGTGTTVERSTARDLADDAVYAHEKDFDPSRFDEDVQILEAGEHEGVRPLVSIPLPVPALPETIPGFRIQIFLSRDIDEANHMRDSVMNDLDNEWAYIVYDAPYYKVRVGNYADRSTANQMTRRLTELGFKESWVVPDKIMKHPPSRLPNVIIEPRPPLEKRDP